MDFIEITAKDNPLIKLASSLQSSSKARNESGLFALEGLRICKDAYENSIRFDKLIITNEAYKKYNMDIEKFAENSDKCYLVTDVLFKKISDTNNPQGILAIAKTPQINIDISTNKRYIGLENIADPSNLGAISRTAEALGFDGIILTSTGCDPYSPKSLRSSMGTLLRMPLYITEDLGDFLKTHNLNGYACVVDDDATSISSIRFNRGDVLLIGNEANGLSEQLKNVAKERVTIPMRGKAESLNAAAAAAIVMWEAVRFND